MRRSWSKLDGGKGREIYNGLLQETHGQEEVKEFNLEFDRQASRLKEAGHTG